MQTPTGGSFNSCVIREGGSAQCWGFDGFGELGINSSNDVSTPIQVLGLTSNVQTIGLTRTVSTQAGMVYELSLDYAGRPGFTADYTRIGVYVDGVFLGRAQGLGTALYDIERIEVLRALARAVDTVKAQPDFAKSMLKERLQIDDAEIALLWPDYRFGLGLNQSLVATLESTARWAIQENLVKATAVPNFLDFIDVGPLRRVRPAAVTVVK